MEKGYYSFKGVIKTTIISMIISTILACVVYFFTKSFDVFVSIWFFLIACCLAGCIRSLLFEYHIKEKSKKL